MLVFLPSQLESRSEFYHQLGSMLSAGVTVFKALELQASSPPSRSLVRPIAGIRHHLERGATFTEATAAQGSWIAAFDIALIEAGERSGRLDAVCVLLAAYYRTQASLARQVLSDLAYPLFVFHFAVFISPAPSLFLTGNVTAYLTQVLGILVPIYALVGVGILACQSRNGRRWRFLLERVLAPIPMLGSGRRKLALARLAAGLEALINAGVGPIEAWELAATACGSTVIENATASWRPKIMSGTTPGELVRTTPVFPELFAGLYQTAELSGTLDQTLKRLHAMYQEEGTRSIRGFCMALPRLVFLLIAVGIGIKVIQFWSGYFKQIGEVMK